MQIPSRVVVWYLGRKNYTKITAIIRETSHVVDPRTLLNVFLPIFSGQTQAYPEMNSQNDDAGHYPSYPMQNGGHGHYGSASSQSSEENEVPSPTQSPPPPSGPHQLAPPAYNTAPYPRAPGMPLKPVPGQKVGSNVSPHIFPYLLGWGDIYALSEI